MSNQAMMVGGWTSYHAVTPADNAVFNTALNGFVGVHYTPTAVSTQVVAGENFRFKCTAEMPPADVMWEAIVEIFQPLNGPAYITGISRI